jgi:hypothetical protein
MQAVISGSIKLMLPGGVCTTTDASVHGLLGIQRLVTTKLNTCIFILLLCWSVLIVPYIYI